MQKGIQGMLAGPLLVWGGLTLGMGWTSSAGASTLWSGGTDSDWFTISNWIYEGIVPLASTDALIQTSTGNTPTISSGNTGVAKIVVVGGGASGLLTINGTLNSSSGWLGNDPGTASTTGTVNVSGVWSNSSDLHVGKYSVGTLNINGGTSSAAVIYLGSESSGNGTITLTGAGSTLTSSGMLFVGQVGAGTLTANTGTSVTSAGAELGSNSGSSGTVSILGGTWNNSAGNLTIGVSGTGTLSIQSGGSVTNTTGVIGSAASSTGSKVTVTGSGSTWTNSSGLFVGIYGTNSALDILSGGKVTSTNGVLARYIGADSTVNINGSGSAWTLSSDLRVGGDSTDSGSIGGTGTLNIGNGAGSGGTVSDANANIGDSTSSIGTVTVNGGTWTNSGDLGIGYYGKGTLLIENGGTVSSSKGIIGWQSSSTDSSVTVTGSGSSWTLSNSLYIGNAGKGVMTVSDGGEVSSLNGYVGTLNAGGQASSMTVTGSGSSWSVSGDLVAGYDSNATGVININDGASVTTSGQGMLGHTAGSSGTATIDHATWSVGNDFNVGWHGSGNLTIQNGGTLTSNRSYIGNESDGSGTALITGSGSSWKTTGNLYVGVDGTGTLTVADTASVSANSIRIAYYDGSTGTLNIGAAEGSAAASSGTLNTPRISFGEGLGGGESSTGSLVFNHTNTGLLVSADISGNGTMKVLSGTTILSGAISNSGLTSVSGGTLSLTGSFSGGSITVGNGATLSLSQGLTANLSGNYTQTTGSTLRLGASSSNYGKLNTSGTATLAGNLFVDVSGISGNSLTSVIHANAISGAFDAVLDNSTLFDFSAVYRTNDVDLSVASSGSVLQSVLAADNSPGMGAAQALDQIFTSNPSGPIADSFMGITGGNQAVSNAVSQTLPLLVGSSQKITGAVLSSINRVVQARLESNRGLSSGDSFYGDKKFWMKPFGSKVDQDDQGSTAGYSATTLGLAFGADTEVSDQTRLGISFAYANANVDGSSKVAPNRSSIDLYQLVGYGSRALDANTELSFLAGIGQNKNRGQRQILFSSTTAHMKYDSLTALAGIGLGRTYVLSGRTSLVPTLRADYTWVRDAAYNETGAGALNLEVEGRSYEELIFSVDGKLNHELENNVLVTANLGVGYDALSNQASITAAYAGAPGNAFVTKGLDPSPWLLKAGLGLVKTTGRGLEISARYDAEHRNDFLNQTASVKLRWAF